VRDRTRRLRGGRGLGGGEERRRRQWQAHHTGNSRAFERAGTKAAAEARALRKTAPAERRRRFGGGESVRQMQQRCSGRRGAWSCEALCQTGFRPSSCDGRKTSKAGCAGARPLSSQTRVPKRPRRRNPARRSDARSRESHAAGQRGGEIGGCRARQRRPRRRAAARATIRRPRRSQLMARRRQARRLRRLELRHARRW
jgi:hypothetical protein